MAGTLGFTLHLEFCYFHDCRHYTTLSWECSAPALMHKDKNNFSDSFSARLRQAGEFKEMLWVLRTIAKSALRMQQVSPLSRLQH